MLHKCEASDCDRMIDDPYKFCSIECAGYSSSRSGATYCRDCGTISLIGEPCLMCSEKNNKKY